MVDEPNPTAVKPSRKRRWVFLGTALLCLASLAAGFYWFYLARPVGSGPAGPIVPREPFEHVWSERKVLLLAMGDSITAGFGMNKGYGYVDRMLDNPPDEFAEMQGIRLRKVLPNIRVENISVSGSTSLEHRHWIDTKLETQPNDVFGIVVMTTGGNDLIHYYGQRPPKEGAMYGATFDDALPWIENFAGRLNEMIQETTKKFPGGCLIFLADIYDPTDGVGDATGAYLPAWPDGLLILGSYNVAIHAVADRHEHVFVVPLRKTFLGHGTHCTQIWRKNYHRNDPTYWYAPNLEDPNIRGFDAIRRIFLIEIANERQRIATP